MGKMRSDFKMFNLKNMLRVAISVFLLSTLLTACDKFSVQGEKQTKSSDSFQITSFNGQIFYMNRKSGKVHLFRDGEFVQIPVVGPAAKDSDQGVKALSGSVKDLYINARLKYREGKLLYIFDISPKYTPEYAAYRVALIMKEYAKESAASSNEAEKKATKEGDESAAPKLSEPPLVEPKVHFANPDWEKYWDRQGNVLTEDILDKDQFPVATIDIVLQGSANIRRTRIIDEDGKVSSYQYYGEQAITLPDFQRIESLDTRWILKLPGK